MEVPPGDYYREPAIRDVAGTVEPINVQLPVEVKVFYDWARGQGWHFKAGTISNFVEDFLLTHFKECLGLDIFVGLREEILHHG